MMLFDDEDSIELDNIIELDNYKEKDKKEILECVALPLKDYIPLKDLWVPSELLPSRYRALDSNRNRSHIFHTLEKRDVELLSVYLEDSYTNLDNRGKLTNPLPYNGVNNQNITIIDKQDPPELYYSDNTDEHVNVSENKLDNDKQITNSFGMNSKVQLCEEPFSNNVVTEPSITYQKSESNNGKQLGYFLDIINNEESLSSDSFDDCTNKAAEEFLKASQTPEKEECDDNIQFKNLSQTVNTEKLSCDDSLVKCSNDVEDLAFQKPVYQICNNAIQFENLDTVNTKQPLYNDIDKCPSQVVTELPIVFEKHLNKCDNTTQQLLDAESTEEQSFVVESEKCEYEPIIELPIAYKRPTLEESKKKQRNQKKKKTPLKKNLQLGDFLLTANPEGYDDLPKKDEFYENLVKQGMCYSSVVLSSEVDYPSFKSEKVEFCNTSKNSCLKEERFAFHSSSVSKEEKLQSDPVALNPVDKEPTTTLVLENISKEITKKNIESLMQSYGELKELSLKPCGKFIKVHVKLILDCDDVDWLIECLNEQELFGASGGVVKCYKL